MTDERKRPLFAVGYAMAVMLMVVPLFDAVLQSWPPTPGEIRWRYGLIGYVGNGLFAPLSGWVLLMLTAAVLGHAKVVKAVAVLSWIGAVGFFGAIGLFVLDATQLRQLVNPELGRSFDSASIKATGSLTLGCIILAWTAWAGWKAAGSAAHRRTDRAEGSPGIVVGRPMS